MNTPALAVRLIESGLRFMSQNYGFLRFWRNGMRLKWYVISMCFEWFNDDDEEEEEGGKNLI